MVFSNRYQLREPSRVLDLGHERTCLSTCKPLGVWKERRRGSRAGHQSQWGAPCIYDIAQVTCKYVSSSRAVSSPCPNPRRRMPRLPPSLARRAHAIDPCLSRLLPACRDLNSARNELRWLHEHASAIAKTSRPRFAGLSASLPQWQRRILQTLVVERATGKPLQYILGNQPFGDLDILCKPGVLIPRSTPLLPNYTLHTAY